MSHSKTQEFDGQVGARLKQLIDAWHGGNVRVAAAHSGVSLATLYRILNKEIATPRQKVLEKMVASYGASLDWLLRGVGDAPVNPDSDPFAMVADVWKEWQNLVKNLGLPLRARVALAEAANRSPIFANPLTHGTKLTSDERAAAGFRKAQRREIQWWIALVSAFVDALGVRATGELIARQGVRALESHFSGAGGPEDTLASAVDDYDLDPDETRRALVELHADLERERGSEKPRRRKKRSGA